jgi:hypothetical protein
VGVSIRIAPPGLLVARKRRPQVTMHRSTAIVTTTTKARLAMRFLRSEMTVNPMGAMGGAGQLIAQQQRVRQ